ncbi:hypothetical protein GP486_005075 [Trichoglossum hirsutum]|uniref:Uncharacterized protein n=1 Tax=Trichoglossum hirsutum TaxID=265104 RepID=A0A9P8L9V0_9PEZI|nr:hypothetical protein GP486_005075 [Trichoglossum hirsutum]
MPEPSHLSRRFLALPLENTRRSHRSRFIDEPIEITSKSNRKKATLQNARTTKGLARDERDPETVETTSKANRIKAIPEPVQTKNMQCESTTELMERKVEGSEGNIAPIPIESTTRRRFAPQLIETTKRRHRSRDAHCAVERGRDDEDEPPLLPHERTHPRERHLGEVGDNQPTSPAPQRPGRPGAWELNGRRRPMPIPPANTRSPTSTDTPQYPLPRRTSSTHPHDNTQRHSFVVPSLEPIISQPNSDESNCPSLSTSPSLSSETSSMVDLWHHTSGTRESCDDRFSGYLLTLAARAAEKQLREQAMAAYVNDDHHEPVEHFANDRESDDSDGDILELELVPRRANAGVGAVKLDSQDEFHWEARNTQKYRTKGNRQRGERKSYKLDSEVTRPSIKDDNGASTRLAVTDASEAPRDIIGGWQKGIGLGPMRDAASPPMLGGSLEFGLCYSPQQTTSELERLSQPNASLNIKGGGLWMGLCSKTFKDEGKASKVISRSDKTPLALKSTFVAPQDKGIEKLNADAEIDREFNDVFVTQVYNYLSLGYPCLARKFDVELSRVSGIPLEEIASADQLADAKGYVGLGGGVGTTTAGVADSRCGRWKALRSYIREWAKQSSSTEVGVGFDAWGMRARKGSWAI